NNLLIDNGYQPKVEFGIAKRRFFIKDTKNGDRLCHVHIFEIDDFNITRHIAFRNYLYSHKDVTKVYENLKIDLAKKYTNDINSYTNGKDKFIKEIEKKAIDWYTKH